ncbi:hypothetical protein FQA47_015079 [Oryzias melastigma]|uniref:Uncharacterized protein n=1 Tax=Oryzias melastigma TaxID=30732 RepID=A0A834FM24_ORYME|nr:hypothetical protein FQA47_015079 [Oryzias melastigma]
MCKNGCHDDADIISGKQKDSWRGGGSVNARRFLSKHPLKPANTTDSTPPPHEDVFLLPLCHLRTTTQSSNMKPNDEQNGISRGGAPLIPYCVTFQILQTIRRNHCSRAEHGACRRADVRRWSGLGECYCCSIRKQLTGGGGRPPNAASDCRLQLEFLHHRDAVNTNEAGRLRLSNNASGQTHPESSSIFPPETQIFISDHLKETAASMFMSAQHQSSNEFRARVSFTFSFRMEQRGPGPAPVALVRLQDPTVCLVSRRVIHQRRSSMEGRLISHPRRDSIWRRGEGCVWCRLLQASSSSSTSSTRHEPDPVLLPSQQERTRHRNRGFFIPRPRNSPGESGETERRRTSMILDRTC